MPVSSELLNTTGLELLRSQFILKVDSLNNAKVVDYKALMLPSDDEKFHIGCVGH